LNQILSSLCDLTLSQPEQAFYEVFTVISVLNYTQTSLQGLGTRRGAASGPETKTESRSSQCSAAPWRFFSPVADCAKFNSTFQG
jgi:hypothetical protein